MNRVYTASAGDGDRRERMWDLLNGCINLPQREPWRIDE